jgi:hypothetical protein
MTWRIAGRILTFATLGGMTIGAAAGGLLTFYGMICGAALGLGLGPVCGALMVLAVSVAGPRTAALLTPPAVVVGGAGLLLLALGHDKGWFMVVLGGATLVAVPMLLTAGWMAAPWCLGSTDSAMADRSLRAVIYPAAFAGITYVGWVGYFGATR